MIRWQQTCSNITVATTISFALCFSIATNYALPVYAEEAAEVREENVIVLLAEFPDARLPANTEEVQSLLSEVDALFRDASFNKLSVKSTVIPTKYTMRNTLSFYNRGGFDNTTFLQELLMMADKDVNFDNAWILVYHAGIADPTGNAIYRKVLTPDGETILGFARVDSNLLASVTVHELAHLFGRLPDLYDLAIHVQDLRDQYQSDIFYYDLDIMGAKTHGGFSAYSKMKLGWMDLNGNNVVEVEPSQERTVTLTPVDLCRQEQDICAIKVPIDDDSYYLIEVREIVDGRSKILQPRFEGIVVTFADESIRSGDGPVRLMSINGYSTQYVEKHAYATDTDTDNTLFVSQEHGFMVKLVSGYTITVAPAENISYHDPVEVKVRVTDFLNRAQRGLPVDVSKENYVVTRAVTNDYGVATFNTLQPGHYGITLDSCFRCVEEVSAIVDPAVEEEVHITINAFMFHLAITIMVVLLAIGLVLGLIFRKSEREAREKLLDYNNVK